MALRPDAPIRSVITEPGDIFVISHSCLATPRVIRVRDLRNVITTQYLMGPVRHLSQLTCVDEQRPPGSVPLPVAPLIAGHEPETHRYLRCVEKLARQGNDAIDQIVLDNGPADVAFT
jgi:hypothetical protein